MVENAALLDELLGLGTSVVHGGNTPNEEDEVTQRRTVAARGSEESEEEEGEEKENTNRTASPFPVEVERKKDDQRGLTPVLSSHAQPEKARPMTMKELKAQCSLHGLLTVGKKHDLQQRLQRYTEEVAKLRNSGLCTPPTSMGAVVAGESPQPSSQPMVRSGFLTTTMSSVDEARPTPLPALLHPVLSPLRARGASGSPPRTVFRYTSLSPPSSQSVIGIGGGVGEEQTKVAHEQQRQNEDGDHMATPPLLPPQPKPVNNAEASTAATSHLLPSSFYSSSPAARVRVPAPHLFAAQWLQLHRQQQQQPPRALRCRSTPSASGHLAAAAVSKPTSSMRVVIPDSPSVRDEQTPTASPVNVLPVIRGGGGGDGEEEEEEEEGSHALLNSEADALLFVTQTSATNTERPEATPPPIGTPVENTNVRSDAASSGGGCGAGVVEVHVSPDSYQLLVDTRERLRGTHEGMLGLLRKQLIPVASHMLPCGDYMVAIPATPPLESSTDGERIAGNANPRYPTSTSAGPTRTPTPPLSALPTASLLSAHGVEGGLHDGVANDSRVQVRGWQRCDDDTATRNPLSEPHRLPLLLRSVVVERKTAADLEASVKGSRYTEQRRLLSLSPFHTVIWLIEGEESTLRHGGGGTAASATDGARSAVHRRAAMQTRAPFSASSPTVALVGSESGKEGEEEGEEDEGGHRSRVDAACASLSTWPRFCVVRTRTSAESAAFLKLLCQQQISLLHQTTVLSSTPCHAGRRTLTAHPVATALDSSATTTSTIYHLVAPLTSCLAQVSQFQRQLRAQTAFPRMLMCIRGCSATLAVMLAAKYGSLHGLWRTLHSRGGREAFDADPDIKRLTTAQKKVAVLLTEFLLAEEYM